MKLTLVGHTVVRRSKMAEITGGEWKPESVDDDASALAEFAGRACYQSWNRPNPATATNTGYLANIMEHEHYSVLEHGTVSIYVQNVSRSLTHELVRHRHFSYSQLSQRFVRLAADGPAYVTPPLFYEDPEADLVLFQAWEHAVRAYHRLVDLGTVRLRDEPMPALVKRKRVREAARCVLPNMTPTSLVITGNHRAWREMLAKRGNEHADAEIRTFAIDAFQILRELEPSLYQDARIRLAGDPVRCAVIQFDDHD